MQKFSEIYNDVFFNEKPGGSSKYTLNEMSLIEITPFSEIDLIFNYSFVPFTTKECNYHNKTSLLHTYIKRVIRSIKKAD